MASSSSSSTPLWLYDVFPSFSGEDVRNNFLSHLLKELGRKGIVAFVDNKIKKGGSLDPELKKAIRQSRIAVVVFSENYASSTWCLNELLEIVTCMKVSGKIVIPIFHRLAPSDVRNQTGVFGSIFTKTCKNQTEEVKTRWKNALKDVANIAGYHSHYSCDSEATLIEEISTDILGKLNSTPSDDFEGFVGLEDHMAKLRLLLDMESDEVRMVGIWGLPGVGKTTIARVLYNQLDFQFQGSLFIDRSFVYGIMRSYSEANTDDYNTKLHLQTKFLSVLLGQEGMEAHHLGSVRERLMHMKVLVVIDDLDNLMVLEALVGQNDWFAIGSRVIVTSRNKQLLRAHGIHYMYEVVPPSDDLALEILCLSAFGTKSPPEGFEKLTVEVARHAGNLPLGLRVLGSRLRGLSKDKWLDILPRLQTRLGGDIQEILKLSYDGLDDLDKALFRYIACLFNLEKVNDIMLLLADSELDVRFGLKQLVDWSLINIRSNIVEMPILLENLGKEIVRKQSKNPGKREFLWDSKDICSVLELSDGSRSIIGISLDTDEIEECYIHEDAFKAMHNLRFLSIFSSKNDMFEKKVKVHLPDSFNHLPPKLILLRWDGYPMKRMPSNFCPKSLVKLKMKNSKLKRLWESDVKVTCLKEMNLWGSEDLKEIPDISSATNLEKLFLGYCLSWMRPPTSIRMFNKQTTSGMLECRNLETLPWGIVPNSSKRLVIMESSNLCLEQEGMQVGLLGESRAVSFNTFIPMVTTLPDSLRVLFLSDIPNMVELPFSINNLNKLTDLRITRCANLETLPVGINLESLERLNLNGCSRLRTFPDISRNISSLYLEETSIEEVPWWIQNFSKLKYLVMQRCSKLEYVYLNISKLKHLEFVNFSHCGALTSVECNEDHPSFLALEALNIDPELPVSEDASTSLEENNVAKVEFSFINCLRLDQEVLLQQLSSEKLVLSGVEMPLSFTHCTAETSMAFPLPQTQVSPPFFMFRACAVVVFDSKHRSSAIGVCIKVNCRFIGRLGNHFDSPTQQEYFSVYQKGSHLLLFDCAFPLNKDDAPVAEVSYDYVDIQFHMSSGNSKFKLREWGIRLSKDFSSSENRLANSNTLREICEDDDDERNDDRVKTVEADVEGMKDCLNNL